MQYRLYFLDEQGHIARAIVVEGADDQDAIARATSMANGCAMELWHEATRVKRFERQSDASPA